MNCLLCSDEAFEDVSGTDSKSGDALRIVMCRSCGLVQQADGLAELDLSFYYSHTYRKQYKKTLTPKPKHVYRASVAAVDRLRFLARSGVKSGSLLDVGSGGGEFVFGARNAGFDASGIEPNEGYAMYARRELGLPVACGFLGDAEGQYDVVTAFHVLEHLPDPLAAFEKLHSLVRPSGKLFVEVPWIEAKDASPHNIYFRAHVTYFTPDTLAAAASPFFRVLKTDTSANLRMVLIPRAQPVEMTLPDKESISRLRKRLRRKGWLEYLVMGGGAMKPARKIARAFRESRVKDLSGRQIAENVFREAGLPDSFAGR